MSLTTPLAAPAPATTPLRATARSSRAGPVAALLALDAALVLGLAAVGLVLRLPYLWTVPRFTDETREVLRAVELLNGNLSGPERLVNVDRSEIQVECAGVQPAQVVEVGDELIGAAH